MERSRPRDSERVGFLVHGRVQGVGFRMAAARRARELGLRGTVQNRRDGRVELHCAGEDVAVREMEGWLHRGPPAARVDRVERIPAPRELPARFEILR